MDSCIYSSDLYPGRVGAIRDHTLTSRCLTYGAHHRGIPSAELHVTKHACQCKVYRSGSLLQYRLTQHWGSPALPLLQHVTAT